MVAEAVAEEHQRDRLGHEQGRRGEGVQRGVLVQGRESRGDRARPETTSSPVTHGPSGRATSTAPPAISTPYAMKEPFISS